MRTYKRKTHSGDSPDEVMLGAMNQVDGRSVYRVALNLDLPYFSKIRQYAFRGSSYI